MREQIHVYGASANGGHAVGLDIDGLRVLVTPSGPEQDAAAVRLAQSIARTAEVDGQLRAANAEVERLRGLVTKGQCALRHALLGKRRFFGQALLLPELAGDWSGAVWLYDPERRERGMGIRFPSLSEVREVYPELWVVGTLDGGVLLDAARLPASDGRGA